MEAGDLVLVDSPIWRIHSVRTSRRNHPTRWDQFREYGPLTLMRWDPHPGPRDTFPDHGVYYGAGDPDTAFAEVFQGLRTIVLSGDRLMTAWTPSRPLRLLNLMPESDWAIRQGVSATLPQATKAICRSWSRSIHDQLAVGNSPQVEGILTPSTVTGQPMTVLFAPASSAFPVAPEFSRPLTYPVVTVLARRAAHRFHWPYMAQ